jgi:D-glycero-D-manno-heptose 1,7-bisphosphate phosphatase
MTNGVFDLLHRGHVNYLQQASELGGSLLVALNTDHSTRLLNKGPERPLNHEMDRAFVLAGLSSVSMVTFFDSPTPVDLIRTVRPDIYVKGGDYDIESLEETRVVRSWNGSAIVIPFVEGFSTTNLVQRIKKPVLRKAVFLDRDGVINRDHGYVHRWEDFEFMPGAIEAMRCLHEAGYVLVIITNQSGIARGYYTEEQFFQLTTVMLDELKRQNIKIEGVYHCPHHPEGSIKKYSFECDCRKPSPCLILKAAQELDLSLHDSILVGDKISDIIAGTAAGLKYALRVISEKNKLENGNYIAEGDFPDLMACVKHIMFLTQQGNGS